MKKILIQTDIKTPMGKWSSTKNSSLNSHSKTNQEKTLRKTKEFLTKNYNKIKTNIITYQPLPMNNNCINLECVDVCLKDTLKTPKKLNRGSLSSLKKFGYEHHGRLDLNRKSELAAHYS